MLDVVVSLFSPTEYINTASTEFGPVTMCNALAPDVVHRANEAEYFNVYPDKICVDVAGVNETVVLKFSVKMTRSWSKKV